MSGELSRNFSRGSMDKDIDERLLPDGRYRDALNIATGESSDSDEGSIQNILGNERMSDIASVTGEVVDNARTIGSVKSDSQNLIYWLVASDNFDAIFEFNKNTGVTSRILQSSKTPGTDSQLGFNQSYLVTGINFENGFLSWVDDLNQPRIINVSRARTYAVDDSRIDLDSYVILKPPLYAPYITLGDDGTQSNNMSEKFLYFAYRYKYIDNQYSSLSPFTTSAFSPGAYTFDPQKGYNGAMVNSFNKVDITFESGNEFVEEIQLVMLDSTSKNVFIIDSFNKEELNIPDNFCYRYIGFNNNKTYSTLPSSQITRLFDNVPLKAKSQDMVDGRLVYGNYVQFYDIVDATKSNILIDFSVDYANDLGTPTEAEPLQTFRSDRDIEIGILYTDEYGRMTTTLTSLTNTVYIKPEDSNKANSLVVSIRSQAPEWATNWRLAIKQSKQDYYNLFPVLFYKDGNYRYFLLNESDRDKIIVGDYVIFKAGPDGVTGSNKQYKILEIELKEAGFISGGVSEVAGLYFKIKVDSAAEFSPNSLFTYSSTGEGVNSTSDGLINNGEIAPSPISAPFTTAENPIFYGNGDGSILTVSNGNAYSGVNDLRFTIEIDSSDSFRYTTALDGSGPYIESNVSITANTDIPILFPGPGATAFTIRFSIDSGLTVGDKWKVSCRGIVYGTTANTNYFGGIGVSQMQAGNPSLVGGYAIIPGVSWSPVTGVEVDRPINTGAIITLNIIEDRWNPNAQAGVQQFPPSDRNYANIEEWFVESGAYLQFVQRDLNNNNVGATRVSFRRGSQYQSIAGFSPGADLSNTVNAGASPTAQTLSYPVRMFIAGCGIDDGPNNQNHMIVGFTIQQQNNSNIVETVPKPNDADIYHELTRTYPVDSGNHIVNWAYEDFIFYSSPSPYNGYTALTQLTPSIPHYFEVGDVVQVVTSNGSITGQRTIVEVPDVYTVVIDLVFPGSGPVTPGTIAFNTIDTDQSAFPSIAKVVVNNPANQNSNYNAWSFGNGLESNRIKDDFNRSTQEYSPRVTSVIEDYKQVRNEATLTYSEEFQESTSVNRLNEFNLSLANFKHLDRSFGSIQKIFARDTDLLVFQQSKDSKVLYGKNALYDAEGGGQITSVPQVLGTQIPFPYEVGIGNNPESFASWGPYIFHTDAFKGSVVQIAGDEIVEISEFGMKSYFRDMFIDGVNTQKLGAFDPYRKRYILASNEISSIPCAIDIIPNSREVSGVANTNLGLFELVTDSSWTLSLVDTGDGTGWLTGLTLTGTGGRKVKGSISLNSGPVRSLDILVTYCGGLTQTFTLTQGQGPKGNIVYLVFNNVNADVSKNRV